MDYDQVKDILEFYERTRHAGHTKAALTGLDKDTIFLTHNQKYAKDLSRYHSKTYSVYQLRNLLGKEDFPMVVDNKVVIDLCIYAMDQKREVARLETKLAESNYRQEQLQLLADTALELAYGFASLFMTVIKLLIGKL